MTTPIPTINSDSSKVDEIAFLYAVSKRAPEGTYLHDLFTEKFLSWVERQIKDDFPPNIMDCWDATNTHGTEMASKVLTLSAEVARLEKTMEDKDHRIQELIDQREDWKKTYDTVLTRSVDLQDKLVEKENELAGKTQEIIALKAAIYDLEHK